MTKHPFVATPLMKYRIFFDGKWQRFKTLEDAKAFAQSIFERFNIVVGIEAIEKASAT